MKHCVKNVQIRSSFWSLFSCIQSEYRKRRTRNNSVFGHFSSSERFAVSLYCKANDHLNTRRLFLNTSFGAYKNSRPDFFCKKGYHENFTKFTGNYLCRSLIFNEFAGWRSAALLKRHERICFAVNFAKFERALFL